MNVDTVKYKNIECFNYGKRLKACISYYENEKAFKVDLYTYKRKILKSFLIFNDNLTRLENYQKAVNIARQYLNTCKY
jgi:hypothetical protein